METQFPRLHEEIQVINHAHGWVGYLDALEYIREHQQEYQGTACLSEFRRFVFSMQALFEPV